MLLCQFKEQFQFLSAFSHNLHANFSDSWILEIDGVTNANQIEFIEQFK